MGSRMWAIAASIPLLVAAAPLGCGGAKGSSSAPDAGAVAAACDDLFAAIVACRLELPAAAMHDAPRFRQACESWVSLPGSTMNVASLECSAQAYKTSCSSPPACPPTAGTLPAGAPCNFEFQNAFATSFQCHGGSCVALPPDAGSPNCGICATDVPAGQPCSAQGPACSAGSFCNGQTCVAVPVGHQVPVGGMCSSTNDCADGPCIGSTCRAQAAAGASCTRTGYSGGIPGSPCEAGLVCDPVSATCVAASVAPGGTCGGSGQLCIFGSCSSKGLCPTFIPDGQPCPTDDTAICDTAATCDRTGKCSMPNATVCQ